jgi:hypothetical protein
MHKCSKHSTLSAVSALQNLMDLPRRAVAGSCVLGGLAWKPHRNAIKARLATPTLSAPFSFSQTNDRFDDLRFWLQPSLELFNHVLECRAVRDVALDVDDAVLHGGTYGVEILHGRIAAAH